ncbi:hypothetical protein BDV96DRAFT_584908 [Lophiotrema nucula]|uniref:Uncharacterized protein n=1 Tax=Lophiotrema nucula TaxID=690887 RepID=A0A6A5YSC4_9PLEO|nr:hypothetical protein BDV96DRAFT_584908 [Lophiotrema nucula]
MAPTQSDPAIPPFPAHLNQDEYFAESGDWIILSKSILQQLHEGGCMEVEHLPLTNLEGEIHPMYSFRNFTNIPRDEYDYVRPALQLATKSLMTDSMLEFFTCVQFGEHKTLRRMQERTSKALLQTE